MSKRSLRLGTSRQLRSRIAQWRADNETIALVPTMGALHEGHLSLVKLAREMADRLIVSIFVNPRQFGDGEDFESYPINLDEDADKLAETGADVLYAPSAEQIYPRGFSTNISVGGVSPGLCGASRPGHFDGVATVVSKLLLQSTPDIAVFGEKDYQQLMVIKRLVTDLELPVEIIGAPIVREKDGLALSSRNAYLSTIERQTAPLLYSVLGQTSMRLISGMPMDEARAMANKQLSMAGFKLDYLEMADAATLTILDHLNDKPTRLLIAARLGDTRLIDNMAIMG